MYHLKVAIFYENMAFGKSDNLVMLHTYKLTQPSLRGSADLEIQPKRSGVEPDWLVWLAGKS